MGILPLSILLVLATTNFAEEACGTPTFIAEVRIVEDYEYIRKNYKEKYGIEDENKAINAIKQDMEYVLYELNAHMESLKKYGLDVQIHAQVVEQPSYMYDQFWDWYISGVDVVWLDRVDWKYWYLKYLDEKEPKLKTNPYDITIYWSGHPLYSGRLTDIVAPGTVCNATQALGFVFFDGTHKTVLDTAQEIFRVLGISKITKSCSSESCFAIDVMNSRKCLSTKTTTAKLPTIDKTQKYYNQIFRVEGLCQKIVGNAWLNGFKGWHKWRAPSSSVVVTNNSTNKYSGDVCKEVKCYFAPILFEEKIGVYIAPKLCENNLPIKYVTGVPTEGLLCDDFGKRCNAGECVVPI